MFFTHNEKYLKVIMNFDNKQISNINNLNKWFVSC